MGNDNPMRYLYLRGKRYQYSRKMPLEVREVDTRLPFIRKSLKTSNLTKAMLLRDMHEKSDNALWAALLSGVDRNKAFNDYKASLTKIAAFRYSYPIMSERLNSDVKVLITGH